MTKLDCKKNIGVLKCRSYLLYISQVNKTMFVNKV